MGVPRPGLILICRYSRPATSTGIRTQPCEAGWSGMGDVRRGMAKFAPMKKTGVIHPAQRNVQPASGEPVRPVVPVRGERRAAGHAARAAIVVTPAREMRLISAEATDGAGTGRALRAAGLTSMRSPPPWGTSTGSSQGLASARRMAGSTSSAPAVVGSPCTSLNAHTASRVSVPNCPFTAPGSSATGPAAAAVAGPLPPCTRGAASAMGRRKGVGRPHVPGRRGRTATGWPPEATPAWLISQAASASSVPSAAAAIPHGPAPGVVAGRGAPARRLAASSIRDVLPRSLGPHQPAMAARQDTNVFMQGQPLIAGAGGGQATR